MAVRVSRATSVMVHQVPPLAAERFLGLQEELEQAVAPFPGYQATEIYPPTDPEGTEWVIVIHFANAASLKGWLDSPLRRELIEKAREGIGPFRQETLLAGFGAWFTAPRGSSPPGWKMVLTVLLGLYPTVLLLTLSVGKVTAPLGLATSMLIGNALSVSLLQWVIMPVLTRVCGSWLRANSRSERSRSAAGVAVIVALIASMTMVFHLLIRQISD
jgi:antibiotic biosynthesis monooxygenase (ABM) superfamily enzyme